MQRNAISFHSDPHLLTDRISFGSVTSRVKQTPCEQFLIHVSPSIHPLSECTLSPCNSFPVFFTLLGALPAADTFICNTEDDEGLKRAG